MSAAQVQDRLANYVPVNERLEQFYADHPEGRVLTTVMEHSAEDGFILMRAEIYRNQDDVGPAATGHAFENRGSGYVNKTSYIENCETSAVGRGLALLGYEIKRGIASREEMQKVERMQGGTSEKVQPINPTVERNVLLKGVMDARKLLAEAEGAASGGDFTPADLADLAAQMFGGRVTDNLTVEELRVLLKELSAKHDAVQMDRPRPTAPAVPPCDCGVARVRKEGTKNGKKWAGWFCANKIKEHTPIWIDLTANETEGDDPVDRW